MMESIRTGVQKPWIKFLLAIVVISFVFAGYFTSSGLGSDPNAVATVNDDDITANDLNAAVQAEAARYGEQFNAMFPTDERRREFRLSVLDKLINSELVAQEVKDLGLRASDSQVVSQVQDIPAFQVDGKFSTAMLDQLLVRRGWSREEFRQMVGDDIAQSQFIQIFSDTELAMPYEVEQRIALQQQERTVKAFTIKSEQFLDTVSISDEEIEQYYQSNLDSYKVAETLTVDYIELTMDDLAADIDVSEDEIKQFYDSNQDLYRAEEERRVAHILVNTEDKSEDEAKAKIDAIAARIASGEDFAEVAKAESEDFSAEQGGDLGFAGRGVMDAEFEKAMFELESVGDVSDVVESEFGFHVIKLLDIKDGDVRPLAEVKSEIETRLKNDKAEETFYIKKDKMAQLAFDRYDSLTAAAAETELEIKTSEPFSPQGGQGIFANAELIKEAYSQDVLVDGKNSSAIEVSEDHAVVLRANQHIPARTKSLEEVKSQVTTALKRKKAREAAAEIGQSLVAKLNDGEPVDAKLSDMGIEWKEASNIRRNSSELGFDITRIAFKAPKPTNGVAKAMGSELMNGDFAVVQVTKVNTPDITTLSDAEQKQAVSRIQRSMGDSGYSALVKATRKDADVVKFEERVQ